MGFKHFLHSGFPNELFQEVSLHDGLLPIEVRTGQVKCNPIDVIA